MGIGFLLGPYLILAATQASFSKDQKIKAQCSYKIDIASNQSFN